ncbi:hypothetical protein E1A91_A05G008700v1 [Gossypium mustelinum]|uniref:5'-nucleotidase domain-containing protein n=3 Tax=Gossypium TaxID=3633 RepID=A0A5J5VI67_GOSBA|nr:hypothetical protein ES319_A05G008500v1 [Gossypium barbadense]TYH14992.1 hypothetical protein ES288_A05G008700v1 [Gossypium darwinii]TYJ32031.1 hypothetical protein E1A91_A05G008700v1 [Gossypium mustelinum]
MASFRRLLPLCSSLRGTRFSSSGVYERFGANVCGYSKFTSSVHTVSKFEEKIKRAEADASEDNDDIDNIRREFDAAKRSFLEIPEALKAMPKTNPEGIYVNRGLRLDLIQVYGFDYDFTLAHYSANLQNLIYDLAKEHMVKEFKYPEVCMSFKYDPSFPIRGLYYDREHGCLLKLDFFGSIEEEGCFYGRHQLSEEEIVEIYGTRHIGRDQARRLVGLMDFFCFSEGQLLQFLRILKEKGKRLFLLTNSPYYFVDGGMQFMLEDSTGNSDSWKELFDVVIAKANKPGFYTSEHPFRCYDTEKDTLAFTKVDTFLKNKIYYHGSLKSFLQITKWKGPEVIYFGDHLFSDLRGPSKAGWRTAAIIHELEDEIRIQNEDRYRFEQAKFHILQELLGRLHAVIPSSKRSEAYKLLFGELNEERQKARSMMKRMFNTSFGATFLTDKGQESAFAYHIHQYADVYTSKPENFLFYSPETWLHAPCDIKIMPHHVKIPSSLFKTSRCSSMP